MSDKPFNFTLRHMNTFERTEEFDDWLADLKDKLGRARIALRIRSAEHGNFGDCEPVGEGVLKCVSISGRATVSRFSTASFCCPRQL